MHQPPGEGNTFVMCTDRPSAAAACRSARSGTHRHQSTAPTNTCNISYVPKEVHKCLHGPQPAAPPAPPPPAAQGTACRPPCTIREWSGMLQFRTTRLSIYFYLGTMGGSSSGSASSGTGHSTLAPCASPRLTSSRTRPCVLACTTDQGGQATRQRKFPNQTDEQRVSTPCTSSSAAGSRNRPFICSFSEFNF